MNRFLKAFSALSFALCGFTVKAQTLSLEECLHMADENAPELMNSRLDTEAALLQKQEAFCEYFPKFSLSMMGFEAVNPLLRIGVNDLLGNSDAANNIKAYINTMAPIYGIKTVYETLQYGYGATLSVSQPIYAGGRIVNGNRLASLGIEAAQLQESIQERRTAIDIEKKYWMVVSLQEKAATLDKALEMLDTLSRDVNTLLQNGILTESEMMQLRLRQGELRKDKLRVKAGIRLAKMDLFNTIGMKYCVLSSTPEQSPFIDDVVLEALPENLDSPATCYMPVEQKAAATEEARLLELQLKARHLEKRMTMGEALPTIGLGASAGYGRYIGDGSANAMVFAVIKVPISDWGKTSLKMRRQKLQIRKAENEKDFLDNQLVLRTRQRWSELEIAWEQLQLSEENVLYAREEMRRSEVSLEAGLCTMSQLLEAQMTLKQAQDGLIDDRIAYKTALSEYLAGN